MSLLKALTLAVFTTFAASAAFAAADTEAPRLIGKASAPVQIEEFVSMTCSHCADFHKNILPEIEKKYVETGKLKIIMHDFPLDAVSLKASAIARCMPAEQYIPFIKTLFSTQSSWAFSTDPLQTIIQYARLGGLPEAKAKACAADTKIQDEILAERTKAAEKYNITGTPTFVVNEGAETFVGATSVKSISDVIDRFLAPKK